MNHSYFEFYKNELFKKSTYLYFSLSIMNNNDDQTDEKCYLDLLRKSLSSFYFVCSLMDK